MFVVVSAAEATVPIVGWVTLAGVVGVGGIAYFVVLLAFSSHFRLTLRNVLSDLGFVPTTP
jgi:hypothetical protein